MGLRRGEECEWKNRKYKTREESKDQQMVREREGGREEEREREG